MAFRGWMAARGWLISLIALAMPAAFADAVELKLGLDAQPLANPAGGRSHSGTWMQQLNLTVTAGSGLHRLPENWREQDHWRTRLQLSLFSGVDDLNERIGAAFPLQSVAYPSGLWLTEASLERQSGAGAIGFKAGVFALNPDFVEAPVLNAYVHSALNNTLNLDVTGLPVNPYVAPGVRLTWTPDRAGRWGRWQVGAFWLGPQDDLAGLFGVQTDAPVLRGAAHLLQWSHTGLPGQRQSTEPLLLPGGPVPRLLPPPLLQLGGLLVQDLERSRSTGAFTSTLTLAAPLPLGLDNRLWLGLNAGQRSSANPVPLFVSGGWLSQGPLPGRPRDLLASGYGRSRFRSPGLGGLRQEAVLELNYSWHLDERFSLQPVLQWVFNPGGSNRLAPILATGVQLQLRF